MVDPDSVSEGISEVLKIKANQSEINKLNALLESKEKEIDIRSNETIELQKKITKQEIINRTKDNELKEARLKLAKYEEKEKTLDNELSNVKVQVKKIMEKVHILSRKACLMEIGMSRQDIIKILGHEKRNAWSSAEMYYGKIILHLNHGSVLVEKEGCN